MTSNNKNLVWSDSEVTPAERSRLLGHQGCVIWMTGLSGSGKSTIARALELSLIKDGYHSYILDGDNIRHGLNGDLGFTQDERSENIRRVAEVAALFADAGVITITAFISPLVQDRSMAKSIIERTSKTSGKKATPRFFEVFINTPLEVCEARDPKQFYKKARAGEIANFTGISAPFENPLSPDLDIPTASMSVEQSIQRIREMLDQHDILMPHP